MYKVALQRWIQGKIGPKDIDLLVKTKHLTAVQGVTIKATERLVPREVIILTNVVDSPTIHLSHL